MVSDLNSVGRQTSRQSDPKPPHKRRKKTKTNRRSQHWSTKRKQTIQTLAGNLFHLQPKFIVCGSCLIDVDGVKSRLRGNEQVSDNFPQNLVYCDKRAKRLIGPASMIIRLLHYVSIFMYVSCTMYYMSYVPL